MLSESRCPRCGAGRLLGWAELDEEQREVIKRLPDAVQHTQSERETLLRWCPQCWFEASPRDAKC